VGTPKNWIQVIGILMLLSSCQLQEKMKCEVKSIRELSDVPSASGIEYIENSYYVIGDNVPWIYVLDSSFNRTARYELGGYMPDKGGIIPKAEKHDFEAMTEISWKGKSHLFIFGSGSKQPYRFEGKMIALTENHTIQTFSLQKLYDRIRDEAKLDPSELNIEAAAEVNGKLYLFNRGKNRLIVIGYRTFYGVSSGRVNPIENESVFHWTCLKSMTFVLAFRVQLEMRSTTELYLQRQLRTQRIGCRMVKFLEVLWALLIWNIFNSIIHLKLFKLLVRMEIKSSRWSPFQWLKMKEMSWSVYSSQTTMARIQS